MKNIKCKIEKDKNDLEIRKKKKVMLRKCQVM